MLYREILAVCFESHTKHINTLCGQNVELLNVKPGGTYSNHWALEGYWGIPMTATYSGRIQDLCSTFMNQNHRFIRPWEDNELWLIWAILQRVTARNVKCPVLRDQVVINRVPSASTQNFMFTSVGTRLQQPWRTVAIWRLLPATDHSCEGSLVTVQNALPAKLVRVPAVTPS
jgi:uncharacterized membrane protein